MKNSGNQKLHLDWIDGIKAFAILAILLNHFVEPYGGGPWFSNPSSHWPDISTRLDSIFPKGENSFFNLVTFLGWLGDMGPGVFILISGFTLVLSQSKKRYSPTAFYKERLRRIYPLYITIHLLVLLFFIISSQFGQISVKATFLSFLGLRFNNSLFFYMNPSWWFIWVILQLYLFFPLLFKFLTKNSKGFLIVTFTFTILARLVGLLDLTYTNNLYYWMTGMFFGTRLFEFTIGMYLGYLLDQKNESFLILLSNTKRVLLLSALSYLIGFGLSLTYAGSLFSNILITIGLSGIFYGVYIYINTRPIKNIMGSIGVLAFPVFLIHQPFINYVAQNLPFNISVLVNILLIALCFPLGYYINQLVNSLMKYITKNMDAIKHFGKLRLTRLIILIPVLISLIFNLFYSLWDIDESINEYLLAVSVLLLAIYYIFESDLLSRFRISYVLILMLMILFFLFILPDQWMQVLSLVAIPGLIIAIFYRKMAVNQLFNISYGILIILLVYFFETQLREKKPIEVGRWGEYPALQQDNRTVYSLIPNKTTHLKYNNYDYILKTNSMGFHSPEIDLSQKKDTNVFRIFIVGDAFSMPEGVAYDSSYPRLLEQNLNNRFVNKSFQVVNGGVTGYGPNEMLLQLKAYTDTIKPDLIINQIFVNEFAEINLDRTKRLRDIGFKEYPWAVEKFWYSQLSIHTLNTIKNWLDKPNPSHSENQSLLFFYEKESSLYSDSIISKMDNYFENVKEISRQTNSDLMVMYVPGQIEVSKPDHIDHFPHHINIKDTSAYDLNRPDNIIQDLCKKHNIKLFDTEEVLSKHPNQPVYFPKSWHWNNEGHKVIANELSKRINFE